MRLSAPLTALGLVLLSGTALWYANRVPAVVPASAPAADFSAERAMQHVREIAQRPHPSGSVDHARVLQYITTATAALGIPTSVQTTTGIGTRYPVAGQVRNIVARLRGSQAGGKAVLLMAHYDGVPASPGAGDDGSGTAVLLETLRALSAGAPLTHDVIALFTDAEEDGLLGAAAFAREHPFARDVAVVLNFEARGTHGPSLMFETGAGNADVVSVLRGVRGARATSLSTAVYRALPNDTDLSEMLALETPAMNFAFIAGVERYHTAEDDVLHLSAGSVQHHGNSALALARAFANGPLPRPRTADAVFFDFPLLGIIAYPNWMAVVLAVVALVFAALTALQLRVSGAAVLKDGVLGAVALVLSLLVAAGATYAVAAVLANAHAGMPAGGAPQWRGIYAAASTFVVVAVVFSIYALARRVASAAGIALGALSLITLLALATAVLAPGVSFLFTWPALLAATAMVAGTITRNTRLLVARQWGVALVTLFLMVPTIYLMVCVALGLDSVGAIALAVLATITLWVLAPQLEAMCAPRRWAPASLAAAVALVLLIVGLATVRTDFARPAGAAIVYAVDADSQTAWFAGSGSTPAVRRWIEQSASALPDQSPPAAVPRWLARMYAPARIAQLPLIPMAPPTLEVLTDSMADSGRVVEVRVLGGTGARSVLVTAAPGTVSAVAVDGREVDRSRYRSRSPSFSLEYVSPQDSGFHLRLTLPAGSAGELGLLARHVRQGTPPEIAMPARPAGVLPIQMGDATYVYTSVRLTGKS